MEDFKDLKFEDFCPVDDTTAYIVYGLKYNSLWHIGIVDYLIADNKVYLTKLTPCFNGSYLRLGNCWNNKFCYSDGEFLFINDDNVGVGIQPYISEDGFVFNHNNNIFLNHISVIEPFLDYKLVGRPTLYKGYIYFEARKNIDTSPRGWEVWRYNIETKEKEKLFEGANPYCYNDKIFYSYLIGDMFETRVKSLVTHNDNR